VRSAAGKAGAARPAPRTVRELVHDAESRFKKARLFYGHGTRNAREEAVFLVFGGLGLAFDCPEAKLDRPLPPARIARVLDLIAERIRSRRPAAYLLNKAWFAGLEFYVDERVLVPRSPFAELIEQAFSPWVHPDRVRRIADLCTGSGCIAIACALAFPGAKVDATDISPDALAVARRNVERHDLGGRVRLVQSDLFAGLGRRRYDLIVSNPPYVPVGEMAELPREYHHEPALGLAAADDGLAVVVRLLHAAARFLAPDGVLIVEVGDRQDVLSARFPRAPFLWLDLERGGDGVFLLEAADVRRHFGEGHR
jgi:ribosomal protein L3 glutamine methyltransferase